MLLTVEMERIWKDNDFLVLKKRSLQGSYLIPSKFLERSKLTVKM